MKKIITLILFILTINITSLYIYHQKFNQNNIPQENNNQEKEEKKFLLGLGEPIEWNKFNNGRNLDLDQQMNHLLNFKPQIYRMWFWIELMNPEYHILDKQGKIIGFNQKIIQEEANAYKKNIKTLQENGVIIIGMDHLFQRWMTGLEVDNVTVRPNTVEYENFLNNYEIAWRNLAQFFSEIKYWETGNEMNHLSFLKPLDEPNFTLVERAKIQVDLMYRSHRAIRSVNPEAFIFMPPPYPEGESFAKMNKFIDLIYQEIASRPEKNPRQYFDGISWHPYWYSGLCDIDQICGLDKNQDSWVTENNKIYYGTVLRHEKGEHIPVLFSEFGFKDKINVVENLQKSYDLAQENFPWLWGLVYFRLMDDAGDKSGGEDFGLLKSPESQEPFIIKESGVIFKKFLNK